MRLIQLALIAVLATGTVAWADHDIDVPYEMPEGTAVIDGDLSDWAGATWIPLDEGYSGGIFPADITNAFYAARWDDANNVLIVAAKANDSELHLEDYFISWNGQDDIEVYVDAGNNDVDYGGMLDYAQQIFVGAKPGNTGSWIWAGGDHEMNTDLVAADGFAAQVNGDLLTYELAIVPYSYYTGYGGTMLPQAIVDLAAGIDVGLDVAVVSLYNSGADLRFATNNLVSSKFRASYAMQTWTLVSADQPGDADGDGDVDLDDFVILKNEFGTTPPPALQADFDGDGDVDLDDFVILKSNFGT